MNISLPGLGAGFVPGNFSGGGSSVRRKRQNNHLGMKWQFDGFYNWPAGSGEIDMWQMMNVQRATFCGGGEKHDFLTENFCRECVCWREAGTCRQVLVQDVTQLNSWHCCCPILFFDFIGCKLPGLVVTEQEPVME